MSCAGGVQAGIFVGLYVARSMFRCVHVAAEDAADVISQTP